MDPLEVAGEAAGPLDRLIPLCFDRIRQPLLEETADARAVVDGQVVDLGEDVEASTPAAGVIAMSSKIERTSKCGRRSSGCATIERNGADAV